MKLTLIVENGTFEFSWYRERELILAASTVSSDTLVYLLSSSAGFIARDVEGMEARGVLHAEGVGQAGLQHQCLSLHVISVLPQDL